MQLKSKPIIFLAALISLVIMFSNVRFSQSAYSYAPEVSHWESGTTQLEGLSHSKSYEILLRSRHFIPKLESGFRSLSTRQALDNISTSSDRVHVLLQLYDTPNQEDRTLFQLMDVKLLNYIPHYAWFASIPVDKVKSLWDEPDMVRLVRWVGGIQPEDKVISDIWEKSGMESLELTADSQVRLAVSFFRDVALDEANHVIARHGGITENRMWNFSQLFILLPPSRIQDLASEDSVRWIDLNYTSMPIVTHNDGAREASNVNVVQSAPYVLSGMGTIIGIWDGGAVDWRHNDFKRLDDTPRVITRTDTIIEHATHVAGTMAGNGTMSQSAGGTSWQWRGMAPDATIVSYNFNDLITDTYSEAVNTYNIDLAQNSWGWDFDALPCEQYGDYRGYAPIFDHIVTGQYGRGIPIVFSAGDERGEAHCAEYKPYGNIAPPGGTAKNVVTVGAVNSDDQSMTDFSSWGPVDDGRLKPEIVAPGCEVGGEGYIRSTLPGNTYGGSGWCGTSMAAPVVSGIGALLTEQYRRIYDTDENPWPSTIRSLLAHSAQDLGSPGPDYKFGYGLVDAKASVDLICARALRQDSISQGEVRTFPIRVLSGSTELKITLAWDDPAATENAAATLVNDLDLVLRAPDATAHKPWVLDPDNPATSATQDRDNVNNLEQIVVTDPTPGEWEVVVTGHSINIGPQSYSLVANALTDAMAAGLCYLRGSQQSDGSWSSNVGITSLATLAFLNAGYDESDPTVSDAIQYILDQRQEDGSICIDCTHVTYETSLALMALKATHAYTEERSSAANWLTNSQWDSNCLWGSVLEDNWYWGGFGYGNSKRPDLSNSQFAMMALDAADLAKEDATWRKAQTFVHHCQNSQELNSEYAFSDDGGFTYRPGYSNTLSRGSMTGAGIWGLALTDTDLEDPRFDVALDWVESYYTWDYHPVTGGSLGANGDQNMYYYYLSMSKALSMIPKMSLPTPSGNPIWYDDLRAKLEEIQRQDGSWVNANASAWEDNPDLVTAYSLLSLQVRTLAEGEDLELVIILHSPADLHLYDKLGRHVGRDYGAERIEQDIPGSQYVVSDTQAITIKPLFAGNYHLEIVGTGEGEWQLEIIGKQNGEQVSYTPYTGTVTTGTVLATDLNVGAFIGPLTIYSTQPEENPVMERIPEELNLAGQPGQVLHASFNITETTGFTVPTQRISVLGSNLENSIKLPIIITPTNIMSLTMKGGQPISVTVPLAADLPAGVYTGTIVVESINSGAKALHLRVEVGLKHIYLPLILKGG